MKKLRILLADEEIAAQLGITVRTVETHRATTILELGLHSLAELIHYALRQGSISAPSAAEYLANSK